MGRSFLFNLFKIFMYFVVQSGPVYVIYYLTIQRNTIKQNSL